MTTTAGKLTKGARVLVTGAPGPLALAKTDEGAQAATVTDDPTKDGRKLVVPTDLGELVAGPTAKAILAPPVEEAEADPEPAEEVVPPPAGVRAATVNLDALGRLTPDSVVMVGESSTVVPPGETAPERLRVALAELGYEVVGRWAVEDGTAVCPVRPAHPA